MNNDMGSRRARRSHTSPLSVAGRWSDRGAIPARGPSDPRNFHCAQKGDVELALPAAAFPLQADGREAAFEGQSAVAGLAGLAPVCLDYAFSSSTDGYAGETRVSTQSSNPYIE